MVHRYSKILLFFFVLVALPYFAGAQNAKTKLIQKKKKIEKEINQTNDQLARTKKDKQANLNQLLLLNRKIVKREELITTITTEVNGLESHVNALSDTITHLSAELQGLKKEYARMIYSANKNRDAYSRLMFVFASKSFNQAYQRLKYFQQYSAYRQAQVKLIEKTQVALGGKMTEIEHVKRVKLTLAQQQEQEKQRLTQEKDQKNTAIRKLSTKEKELLKTLHEHELAANKLQSAIEALIADEIRKADELRRATEARKAEVKRRADIARKEKEADLKNKSGSPAVKPILSTSTKPALKELLRRETAAEPTLELTPKQATLSNSFAENKGRLPWPVERGTISSSFGEHAHPLYKDIKIKNNGVDIVTNKGTKARAVFNGVVSSVMSIPSMHNIVIIRHGDYLTVYANLGEVYIKKGDAVNIRQPIGQVYTDPSNARTMLQFQIWHSTSLLNPESWIAR
jgi:murein hydrolase activator